MKIIQSHLILFMFIISSPFHTYANNNSVEQDIGASAQFRQALAITNIRDINFGIIEYSENAGANIIEQYAGNSTLKVYNTDYYNNTGNSERGLFNISGTIGQSVDISCDNEAYISDGVNILPIHDIRINRNGRYNCMGLDTVSQSYILTENNLFGVGAEIHIPETGIAAPGIYDTSQAGGDPIRIRVVYQ